MDEFDRRLAESKALSQQFLWLMGIESEARLDALLDAFNLPRAEKEPNNER